MSTTETPGPLTREIAAILRGRVARVRVTQEELAGVAGVSQSQLSKILRGMRAIDIDLLDRLTWALGLGMVDVIAEAERLTEDREHGEWLVDESGVRHEAHIEHGVTSGTQGVVVYDVITPDVPEDPRHGSQDPEAPGDARHPRDGHR